MLFREDPGILEAAALRGVDDIGVRVAGEAGESAWPDLYVVAGEDEGPEVALTLDNLVAVHDVEVEELDNLLSDPSTGVSLDEVDHLGSTFAGEVSAEHDAVAASLGDVLDDEAADIVDDIAAVFVEDGEVGWGVLEDRGLAEVVFDHLRDEVVDPLVVGDAVAEGVHDADVAGAVGLEDVGYSEEAIAIEGHRIHELVGDTSVDDRDAGLLAVETLVEDHIVFDEKLVREGEDRSCLFGEVGVLEEGRVVASWGEDDRDSGGYVHIVHDLAEQKSVATVVDDVGALESLRGGLASQFAGDNRVGGTARDSQVVFEDVPYSTFGLDEVDARDVTKDVVDGSDAVALRKKAFRGEDEVLRDDLVLDDLPVAINVSEECVEGPDPLSESAAQVGPSIVVYDTRDCVEREELFVEHTVFIDAESYAVSFHPFVDDIAAAQ